jgi:hypothetical protein
MGVRSGILLGVFQRARLGTPVQLDVFKENSTRTVVIDIRDIGFLPSEKFRHGAVLQIILRADSGRAEPPY